MYHFRGNNLSQPMHVLPQNQMSAYGSINMMSQFISIKAVRVCQCRVWQHWRLLNGCVYWSGMHEVRTIRFWHWP